LIRFKFCRQNSKISAPVGKVGLALGQSDAVDVIRKLELRGYKGKVLLISGRDEATLEEIRRIGEQHGMIMLPPLKKPFRAGDLKSRLVAPTGAKPPESPICERDETRRRRVDPEEALQKRWLELWYQPKIDLGSMSICGAKALLRVTHPQHGIVLPAFFLPSSGSPIYQPLTEFVIAQSAAAPRRTRNRWP
jgi:hypothetical protein